MFHAEKSAKLFEWFSCGQLIRRRVQDFLIYHNCMDNQLVTPPTLDTYLTFELLFRELDAVVKVEERSI